MSAPATAVSGGEAALATWHDRPAPDVLARMASDAGRGLTATEAARRLDRDGLNAIERSTAPSPLTLLAAQFGSLIIWVLIGAAAVSMALGEVVDGVAIFAIVALNGVVGFLQDYRAERAVAALARMVAPRAKVLRDGDAMLIAAAEVARGDILLLEGGDVVAADGRLLEVHTLRTVEASLTGESEPVAKHDHSLPAATPLADRANLVFMGTTVAGGTGRAVVVGTGRDTEVGRIAGLLEHTGREATPLQRQLDTVGRRLLWACLAIVVLVFVIGLWRAVPPFDMFLGAVGLAVAAIPEGLPAVVTLALAVGVQRMARRNALIRRLASVETLGCTQVICTDKTGTLTVGEMTVRKLIVADQAFHCTGEGYGLDGAIVGAAEAAPTTRADVHELLLAAAACNDAAVRPQGNGVHAVGDPTEVALLVAAAKGGIAPAALDAEMPRLDEIPFDADRKRMTVIRRRDGAAWAAVKGAPEEIIARCTALRRGGVDTPLSAAQRASMVEAVALLASDALRVLALAGRRLPHADLPHAEVEHDLTLLGLIGMQDPPRAEARAAVERCQRAGIRVVMITGDHRDTARAIADELGILTRGATALDGAELDAFSDEALAARAADIAVYARVTAEHKLRIVRALQSGGAVVAMTGDGVNDAAALQASSIGIAMGITGTEVTKAAADMVIADDNFASIVAAVEEGRGIYDNISKTLAYLITGNVGELAVMLFAGLAGWPLPLLPIHLLWINLVTDGLPALALATDPIDRQVLMRPPRDPSAGLANRAFMVSALLTGTLAAGVTLVAFAMTLAAGAGMDAARSAAFSVLVFEELLRSFSARSTTHNVWSIGVFSNLRLLLVVLISSALQIALPYIEVLRPVFRSEPLPLHALAGVLALAAVPSMALEIAKVVRRRRQARLKP